MKIKSIITSAMVLAMMTTTSFADSSRVITLGDSLNETQKANVLNYFGVNENEADIITVNNQQERKYLEGVATEEQLGRKTFSCSYIEPTNEGGINVKLANVTWLTANMVSSTLTTAGVNNANVLVCAPFPVSGTGALTGIFLSYEKATGEKLSEEKKELASEELITTGGLAEDIKDQVPETEGQTPNAEEGTEGQTPNAEDTTSKDVATGIVNDVKADVIKNNTSDRTQIAETINNVCNNYNVTISPEQKEKLTNLMVDVSEQDYNYEDIKGSLDKVSQNVGEGIEGLKESGFFDSLTEWFNNVFNNEGEEQQAQEQAEGDMGILNNVDAQALGENVVQSTTDALNNIDKEEVKEKSKGIWETFRDWVDSMFA